MPLPVIADTFQCSLVWSNAAAPRKGVTTLHFRDAAGGQTEANLFADLDASVTQNMWSGLSTGTRCTLVNITKLDGTSAGQAFAPGAVTKWQGANTGALILQGSIGVSLKSTQRGPRGRNRIYLPWVPEDSQADGVIATANLNAMQTAWSAFNIGMLALGWDLCAVSALHAEQHSVVSTVVRSSMRTQRRRALR